MLTLALLQKLPRDRYIITDPENHMGLAPNKRILFNFQKSGSETIQTGTFIDREDKLPLRQWAGPPSCSSCWTADDFTNTLAFPKEG
jgi:hypothetical protein